MLSSLVQTVVSRVSKRWSQDSFTCARIASVYIMIQNMGLYFTLNVHFLTSLKSFLILTLPLSRECKTGDFHCGNLYDFLQVTLTWWKISILRNQRTINKFVYIKVTYLYAFDESDASHTVNKCLLPNVVRQNDCQTCGTKTPRT